jgi:hypothetical protein
VEVNGTRISNESVMISWREKENHTEERRYLVSFRKINNKLSSVGYTKWRKAAIQYTESNEKAISFSPSTTYTAVLRLSAKSSFEVKITTINTAGDHLGSSSVYFDASDAFVSGKQTDRVISSIQHK